MDELLNILNKDEEGPSLGKNCWLAPSLELAAREFRTCISCA